MKGNSLEKRVLHFAGIETRREGKRAYIEGMIRYNELSEDLGGFREIVAPSAFTRTLKSGSDIKMFWNHEDSEILGSTKSGTLVLENRVEGLHFSCLVPDSAMNRFETVQRGDCDGVSFGFIPEADKWDHAATPPVRTLTAVRLLEISPTPFPAYPSSSATAAQRSKGKRKIELLRLELELALYGRVTTANAERASAKITD